MIFKDLIKQQLQDSVALKKEMIADNNVLTIIGEIAGSIIDAYRNNRKVILFGNGGSAAAAQHIASEFVGKYYLERRPLPAIALTVNTSLLTAIGNDYSFDIVFVRPLAALGQEGDIAIGLSTSGNSENVISALKLAKEKGLVTVGFTGKAGDGLKDIVDYCLRVPSTNTPQIQECHIVVGHIICEIVEMELFANDTSIRENRNILEK